MKKIAKPTLPPESHNRIGHVVQSKYGRKWFPNPEYVVPESFKVMAPICKWPMCDNYKRHIYTTKYLKLLLKYRPDLYSELVNVLPKYIPDEQWKLYHKEMGKKIDIKIELDRCKEMDKNIDKLQKSTYGSLYGKYKKKTI